MNSVPPPASFRALVLYVAREWRIIGYATASVVAIAVAFVLLKPRAYTATAAFISQARRPSGVLGSLAGQLGVDVSMGDVGTESPQFYVDLLSRQSTLRALVDTSYPGIRGKSYRNLVEYFGVAGSTYDIQRDRAVRKLSKLIDAAANLKTSVVTLTATSPEPELSSAIVDRMIALLKEFNLERRKSQAAAERDFVEARLEQARKELRDAENRQEEFFQKNAVIASPRLRLEAERLAQDVALHRALYATLSQSYEQARIDAVRDTPVITVIEPPVVQAEADSRGVARAIIFAVFGGLVLGTLLSYWRAGWTRAEAPPPVQ